MELDSCINITASFDIEVTIREVFAAARELMTDHFYDFPTKEEAKDWLTDSCEEEAFINELLIDYPGYVLDTDGLKFVDKYFDEFYQYAKETSL